MSRALACPSCGEEGKSVSAITLRSLLTPQRLPVAGDAEGYLHCRARSCEIVYFHPDRDVSVDKDELLVRVGTKETDGPRPLCYCFGHSRESIERDLRATGGTDVVEDITWRCRAGEDRCEETNPQGSCCLGNVRRAVREAGEELGVAASGFPLTSEKPCADECSSRGKRDDVPAAISSAPATLDAGGRFAAGGAVVVAALSSACCWLPLLFIGIGAGTSTVAGFFEAYRLWFLAGTAALLGVGFYLIYFREEACAPGGGCETPRVGLKRANKTALWLASLIAVAFAFFPSYVGAFVGVSEGAGEPAVPSAARVERVFDVEGMTCEGCVASLTKALEGVPGVASATVSYRDKTATVAFHAGRANDDAVLAAIERAGYAGARRE